ncbi:MAG: hypothetical protein ACD_20C00097G0030 [uncultured bacterium]|nr:MAG: hypothetical protein ACD_20C00097G0030 [uncultured bacterium]
MADDRRNNGLLAGIIIFLILVIGIIAFIYFLSRTEAPEGLNQTTENVQVTVQEQAQQPPETSERTVVEEETVTRQENGQPQTQQEPQSNQSQAPAGNQTTNQQTRQ